MVELIEALLGSGGQLQNRLAYEKELYFFGYKNKKHNKIKYLSLLWAPQVVVAHISQHGFKLKRALLAPVNEFVN